MINVYKSPISKEKYANLFLDKIPEGAKNVCLLFIGHSETVHYIMSQKPEIDFTVIDGSDVTEALPYIYTADNLKERITFEESDCEDETFLKKLETCFENYIMNNMSFDLILANPPYGKSSSLSKKIVNKMLEYKVAKEYVVLAPPTTFKDFVPYVNSFSEELSTSMFDTVGIASGIPIKVVKLLKEPVNKFSDYAEIVLSDKELVLSKVVKEYNSSHKLPYIDYFSCTLKNKKEVQNTFLISFWSGLCQVSGKVRLGEMWEHNGQGKDIPWRDSSAPYALVFETNNEFCNFRDWWYKTSNEESKTTPFKQFLFSTILHRYGGTPALKCYLEYLPNLDWSKPHTDAEILKEIGLPEDFLEKE